MGEKEFTYWLQRRITEEGWTYEDFGKRVGISKSQVSLVLSGQRSVTHKLCIDVAEIFGMDTDTVLSLAGLKTLNDKKADYHVEDYKILFRKLSAKDRDMVINFIKFLLSEYEKP